MSGPWWRRNFLINILLGCPQCRDGLRHLVLLAGKLVLISGELLYAAFHNGKIKRRGFELRLQFCLSYSQGGRLHRRCGQQRAQRRSPGSDSIAAIGPPSKCGCDTDQNREGKTSKAVLCSLAI
jgi:hypothetical protein